MRGLADVSWALEKEETPQMEVANPREEEESRDRPDWVAHHAKDLPFSTDYSTDSRSV